MGRKTSVYLTDKLSARIEASGRKPADLMAAALDADDAAPQLAPATAAEVREIREELSTKPDTDEIRRIVREEVERATGQSYA
jgi:hypothetical protein